MIYLVIDTNIFKDLLEHPNIESILELINDPNNSVVPHLSIVNFWENLNGIIDDVSLRNAQACIKRAKYITKGGSILPTPRAHIQQQTGQIKTDDLFREAKGILDHINTFIGLVDYENYKIVFHKHLSEMYNTINKIVDGYEKTRKSALCLKLDYRDRDKVMGDGSRKFSKYFKNYLDRQPDYEIYESFIPKMIKRYGLKLQYSGNDQENFLRHFPSIKNIIDIFWAYFRKLTFEGRKPIISDYFDIEQTVYLDFANYFVTEDKKLRDVLESTGNQYLQDIVIDLGEFISRLETNNFPRKSMLTARRLAI